MKRFFYLFGFGLLLCCACRTKGPVFNPAETTTGDGFQSVALTNRINREWLQPSTNLYRLGPGDVIEVEVLGDASLRASLLVGPDGKVYFNLLPGTLVWGLTLDETRALLQKEMGKFTRANPEMVLNLRTVGSQRFWLLGAVGAGAYTLATPTTVLEAISAVGGLPAVGADETVDLQKSFVLRDGRMLPVDFERLIKHGDLSENIYLQPDDFVFLRPGSNPSVSLLGAVGSSALIPYTSDLTLARAIIAAGGTVKYAQVNQVVIIRGALTQPQIAEVDYKSIVTGKSRDIRLQPGDIVYVPFSPFRKIARLAEEILDQVVRTTAVNEGVRVVNPDSQPVGFSTGVGITPGGGSSGAGSSR